MAKVLGCDVRKLSHGHVTFRDYPFMTKNHLEASTELVEEVIEYFKKAGKNYTLAASTILGR